MQRQGRAGARGLLAFLIATTGTLQPWTAPATPSYGVSFVQDDPATPEADPPDGGFPEHVVEPLPPVRSPQPPPPPDPILPPPPPHVYEEHGPAPEIEALREAPGGVGAVRAEAAAAARPPQPLRGETAVREDASQTSRLSTRPVHWTDPSGERRRFENTAVVDVDVGQAPPPAGERRGGPRFAPAGAVRTGAPLLRLEAAPASPPNAEAAAANSIAIGLHAPGVAPERAGVAGNVVTYRSALPGADLRFTVDGERVVKELVVPDRVAALALPGSLDAVSLAFRLDLTGVSGEPQDDGGIAFTSPDGALHFRMLPPFAVDAATPPTRLNPTVDYTQSGDITLALDRSWLLDPGRVYPISIDPSFVQQALAPPESGANDTWLDQANPSLNRANETSLWAGKSGANASHILLQFADLDSLPRDSIISSASLQLHPAAGGGGVATPLEVRRTTADWSETTATWNSGPAYDAVIEAAATSNPTGVTSFDVTNLVRGWASGETANYGVRITPTSTATTQAGFGSGAATDPAIRPALILNYTVATRYGTDRRWSYGPVQAYGGGVSSQVNLTNGNLVVQQVTSNIGARGFDVRLAHVYNSQDPYGSGSDGATVAGAHYGNGWTFSHNIRLAEFDNANGIRLKDGDGTWRVYVKQQDSGSTRSYRRPLYYDYTLTKDLASPPADANKVYTLTADSSLRKYFFDTTGRLKRTEDRNGNYLTYGYDAGSRLTSITDVAGRSTALVYNGAGGRLSRSTDMAGRQVDYGYDASGNLTSITRAPGLAEQAVTEFVYDWMGDLVSVETPRYNSSEGIGASSLLYKSEATFDSSTEGWTGGNPCGGTVTASWSAGALRGDLGSAACGTLSKSLAAAPLNGSRQELVAWVRVQGTAPAMTANLYLEDRYGVTHSGPSYNLTVSGSPWNRVAWPDAPVDATLAVQRIGVKVSTASGSPWTGWAEVHSFAQKGLAWEQRDAHGNTFAKYTYTPADLRTVVARPDQDSTLQSSSYTFNGHGQVVEARDPLNNATTYVYDQYARLVSTTTPAPALVQPAALSGLRVWLKADAIAGVSDGSPVSTWPDSSGNGYHYKGSGTTRPAYKANAVNGKPALVFNGSQYLDGSMSSANFDGYAPFSFIVVAKASTSGTHTFFSNRRASGNGSGFLHHLGSDAHRLRLYGLSAGSMTVTASATTAPGAFHVFAATSAGGPDPSNLALYQDGIAQAGSHSSSNPDEMEGYTPRLGKDPRSVSGLNGELAELLVYNRRLGAGEIAALHGYLASKYAIGSGPTTTLTYWSKPNGDPTGFVQTSTDPLGAVTRFGVDTATGDARYTITPLQEQKRVAGQEFAATIFIRDSAGNLTRREHNRYGAGANLDGSFPTPLQQYSVTQYSYYPAAGGLLQNTTDALGAVTSFDYDNGARTKGYLTSRTHPPLTAGTNRTWTFSVAADGRVTLATDPTARATGFVYDTLGRLTTINRGIQGGGAPLFSESVTYDKNANTATTTNGRGYTTANSYDANNRLTRVTDARNGQTTYTFYPNGLLWKRSDPDNRVTTYTYDARNLLATVANPLGHTWTNSYDAAGNRNSRLDPAGATTTYAYSLRGELLAIAYPDPAQNAAYAFDLDGRRAAMTDARGMTSYAYDPYRGLLTSVTDPVLGALAYQYDAAANRTRTTYPSVPGLTVSRDVDYTYLPGGFLKEVKAPFMGSGGPGGLVATYQYDNGGRQSRLDLYGGAYTTWSYDALGRTTQVFNKTFSTPTLTTNYTYDHAGNITSGPGGSYPYDALNRLTYDPWGNGDTFTYAAGGNRLTSAWYDDENSKWRTTTYAYDAAARLTVIDGPYIDDRDTQEWDAKGNLTKRTVCCSTSTTYTWDHENRRLCTTMNVTRCDSYSGDGLRTASQSGDTSTFLYDLNDPLPKFVVEKYVSSTGVTAYTWYLFGTALLARRTVSGSTPPAGQYYQRDRKDVRRIITRNPVGTLVTYTYNVWGAYTSSPLDPTKNLYKYATEPTSDDGTVYLRARHYDPGTGRFVSADPFPGFAGDPQSQNAYAYAGNNPVTRTDPTGMCPQCAVGGAAMLPTPLAPLGVALIAAGVMGLVAGALLVVVPDVKVNIQRGDDDPDQGYLHSPADRARERRFIRGLVSKYGLSEAERRRLHDEITGQHYSEEEIEQIAAGLANGLGGAGKSGSDEDNGDGDSGAD